MLMEALKPWVNMDHEGVVHPGQRFQAHGPRAVELELAGLAVPVIDEEIPIKVIADPPTRQGSVTAATEGGRTTAATDAATARGEAQA